jgi:hypothetical protein
MPDTERHSGLEQELTQALDELNAALQRASEATAVIRGIVPRLAATGSVLDEIEALVRAKRSQIGAVVAPIEPAAPWTGAYTRPTLVVAGATSPKPRPAPRRQPEQAVAESAAHTLPQPPRAVAIERPILPAALTPPPPAEAPTPLRGAKPVDSAPFPNPADDAGVTCFRLEFESKPGPLDLRTVDDAVGEHPAVRDVALLDYDGRRATLKVWIAATSTPAEVQDALKQRTAELFAPGHDITIVALEDVA